MNVEDQMAKKATCLLQEVKINNNNIAASTRSYLQAVI
jgi:hypothetical protein